VFHKERDLGSGTFGTVDLVTARCAYNAIVQGERYAVKYLEERAQNERDIMSNARHPGIVKLFAALAMRGNGRNYALVMEYCPGGDVATKIMVEGAPGLPSVFVRRYAAQALDALRYLHGEHIMHRDLKPNNLLLTAHGDCKLGDFGFGKNVGGNHLGHTAVGTLTYAAPEVHSGSYDYSADIFSFGITVLVGLFGLEADLSLVSNISNEDAPGSFALISKAANDRPELRGTASELQQHVFFASVNWAGLFPAEDQIDEHEV